MAPRRSVTRHEAIKDRATQVSPQVLWQALAIGVILLFGVKKGSGGTLNTRNGLGLHAEPIKVGSQTQFRLYDSAIGEITYGTCSTDLITKIANHEERIQALESACA